MNTCHGSGNGSVIHQNMKGETMPKTIEQFADDIQALHENTQHVLNQANQKTDIIQKSVGVLLSEFGCYTDAMTNLRAAFFWSGLGIMIGTTIALLIWPEFFGPLAIAALFVSFAMAVLARPWERYIYY